MNADNLGESAPLKLLIHDIQPSQSIQLPTTRFAGSYALSWTHAPTLALEYKIVLHMFRIIGRWAGRSVATLALASAY
jgi:hypothetical protein